MGLVLPERVSQLLDLPTAWNENGISYGGDLITQKLTTREAQDYATRKAYLRKIVDAQFVDPSIVRIPARPLKELLQYAGTRDEASKVALPLLRLWFPRYLAEFAELLAHPAKRRLRLPGKQDTNPKGDG